MNEANDAQSSLADTTAQPQGERAVTLPPGARTFGVALLLASLTVAFVAVMIGYTVIRLRTTMPQVELPFGLWLSTFTIFFSSAVLHYASLSASANRGRAMRCGLVATLILAVTFLCLQIPSLIDLAASHRDMAEQQGIYLYSLVLVLIVLHGLHVIGGLVPMGITTVRALKGRYDNADDRPIRLVAMYWHFLAIVWLVMFSLFMLLR
jgi:heme/copper-type cytochrome/quinol oxidase subunit 3